jgi:hypothetical protein
MVEVLVFNRDGRKTEVCVIQSKQELNTACLMAHRAAVALPGA